MLKFLSVLKLHIQGTDAAVICVRSNINVWRRFNPDQLFTESSFTLEPLSPNAVKFSKLPMRLNFSGEIAQ